jgi:hypothetical protein
MIHLFLPANALPRTYCEQYNVASALGLELKSCAQTLSNVSIKNLYQMTKSMKFMCFLHQSDGLSKHMDTFILPPSIYPRPILKSENSIYARPICVFALENIKSSLWHLCEQ